MLKFIFLRKITLRIKLTKPQEARFMNKQRSQQSKHQSKLPFSLHVVRPVSLCFLLNVDKNIRWDTCFVSVQSIQSKQKKSKSRIEKRVCAIPAAGRHR